MPRLLAFSLLLLALTSAGNTQSARVDRIDIVEWGIYRAEVKSKKGQPGSPTGKLNILTDSVLLQQTATVSARLGVRFGFRFRVIGRPVNARVDLKLVTKYPSQGLRNPDKRETFFRSERNMTRSMGEVGYTGYTFDESWEIEPGTWTFELWQGSQKLAVQTFVVTR